MTRSLSLLTATLAVLAGLISFGHAQDVDPIVVKGSKFFYKTNGTQFYIKGVAYQQDFISDSSSSSDGYTDPLADPAGCRRDIPYLVQLKTNTIRVYAVDPTKDHSECMNMLADAGIYVVADLSSPDMSIASNTPSWNVALYERYTAVIDALESYSNVLGFFAGNEVVNQPNQTQAAPFVKAAARDMKAYIKSKNYRTMPVGYASTDNPYIRVQLADYMNCGDDQANAVDFWGYNVYSWCGTSGFVQSGYSERVQEFSNYSVPVFFAEYGCNQPSPRIFDETPVLYSSDMTGVFSGGIVYLYFQEANNYGLVNVDGDTVSTLADFTNLKSQIATVSPSQTNVNSYSPSNSPQACPSQQVNFTAAADLPPTPDAGLCDCMYSALSCIVASSVDNTTFGPLFSYVCGNDNGLCDGIAANGSTGSYGPYGMCSDEQKLGYVLDQYYSSAGSSSSACDFSGSATLQAAATPTGSCATQLDAASSSVSQGAGASGDAGSGAASSTGGAAGGVNGVAVLGLGTVTMAVLVNVALISGVGMILL